MECFFPREVVQEEGGIRVAMIIMPRVSVSWSAQMRIACVRAPRMITPIPAMCAVPFALLMSHKGTDFETNQ